MSRPRTVTALLLTAFSLLGGAARADRLEVLNTISLPADPSQPNGCRPDRVVESPNGLLAIESVSCGLFVAHRGDRVAGRAPIAEFASHRIYSASFDPSGALLASATDNHWSVSIHEIATGRELVEIPSDFRSVTICNTKTTRGCRPAVWFSGSRSIVAEYADGELVVFPLDGESDYERRSDLGTPPASFSGPGVEYGLNPSVVPGRFVRVRKDDVVTRSDEPLPSEKLLPLNPADAPAELIQYDRLVTSLVTGGNHPLILGSEDNRTRLVIDSRGRLAVYRLAGDEGVPASSWWHDLSHQVVADIRRHGLDVRRPTGYDAPLPRGVPRLGLVSNNGEVALLAHARDTGGGRRADSRITGAVLLDTVHGKLIRPAPHTCHRPLALNEDGSSLACWQESVRTRGGNGTTKSLPRILIFNVRTGAQIGALPIDADSDDIHLLFSREPGVIYVSTTVGGSEHDVVRVLGLVKRPTFASIRRIAERKRPPGGSEERIVATSVNAPPMK